MLSPIIDYQPIHFTCCFDRGCREQQTQPCGNIESYNPRILTSIRLYFLADFPRNYRVIQSSAKEGSSQWRGIGPRHGALLLGHIQPQDPYVQCPPFISWWNFWSCRMPTAVVKLPRWSPCNPIILSITSTRRPTRLCLSNESSATLPQTITYIPSPVTVSFLFYVVNTPVPQCSSRIAWPSGGDIISTS